MAACHQSLGDQTKTIKKSSRLNLCSPKFGDGAVVTGFFREKIPVAVRTYSQSEEAQFSKEFDVLLTPRNLHENFLRYFTCEEGDDNKLYIATELCVCSVADLFAIAEEEQQFVSQIRRSLDERSILRQATEGLAFLHGYNYVHCNIKPSNFLVAEIRTFNRVSYLIKLSDFRMSRKLPEESKHVEFTANGWAPPESSQDVDLSFQFDTFSLGCFYFYVLQNGTHPFGETEQERKANIQNRDFDVYRRDWMPNCTAVTLIKEMIKFQPSERPTASYILRTKDF